MHLLVPTILLMCCALQWPIFAQAQKNFEADLVSGEERSASDAALRSSFKLFDFVENQGQWASDVAYYGRSGALEAWFESDGLRFDLSDQDHFDYKNDSKVPDRVGHSWDMTFEDIQAVSRLVPYSERTTEYNFLKGSRENWVTCAKGYDELRYLDAYPKTDIRFYSRPEGLLEFDFVLHPGADVSDIKLRYEGLDGLSLDENGKLVLQTQLGSIRQEIPVCYQRIDGNTRQIEVSFEMLEDNLVGFRLDESYDPAYALIIDPALTYATFVGCSNCDGYVLDMTVNGAGEVYYGGYDVGPEYPVSTGAYSTSINQGNNTTFYDGVVGKLAADGKSLIYATFIGGNRHDYVYGIGVFNSQIYIAGFTYSSDFPSTADAYDVSYNGTSTFRPDAYFAKLNVTGTDLVYSSYFGGTGEERLYAGAFNKDTKLFAATGYTRDAGMPTTTGAFQDTIGGGTYDSYVVIFDLAGGGASDLVYASYIGGTNSDQGWAIHWDKQGRLWIGGNTMSTDFPVVSGSYQTSLSNLQDGFLLRIDPLGGGTSDVVYSSYFGGTSMDEVTAISSDFSDSIYVAGWTRANNFPTVNAYDATNSLYDQSGFLMKLDPSLNGSSDIIWSTYFGGTSADEINALMVSDAGKLAVISQTESTNFPTTGTAYDPTHNGNYDLALSVLSNDGQTLSYSTFFGGTEDDYVQGGSTLGVKNGNLFLGGTTHSSDFPVYPNSGSDTAFSVTKIGNNDTHVIALFGNLPLPIELMSFEATMQGGGVLLEWATAQEIDNSHFLLQRSINGLDFEDITRVEAAGTVEVQQDYSFLDKTAPAGRVYYRLKQVDLDGYFEYSKIRSVTVDIELLELWVSPNPTRGNFIVNGTGYKDEIGGVYAADGARIPFRVYYQSGKLVVEVLNDYSGMAIVELKRANQTFFRKVFLY